MRAPHELGSSFAALQVRSRTRSTILANDTHGVALVKTSGTRNGKTLESNTVHVVHYNAEGQITESWIIPENYEEANAFWS